MYIKNIILNIHQQYYIHKYLQKKYPKQKMILYFIICTEFLFFSTQSGNAAKKSASQKQ